MAEEKKLTEFDYIMNRYDLAAASDDPFEAGYPDKRKAVFAYVGQMQSALRYMLDMAANRPMNSRDAGTVVNASSIEEICTEALAGEYKEPDHQKVGG